MMTSLTIKVKLKILKHEITERWPIQGANILDVGLDNPHTICAGGKARQKKILVLG